MIDTRTKLVTPSLPYNDRLVDNSRAEYQLREAYVFPIGHACRQLLNAIVYRCYNLPCKNDLEPREEKL
jgi:hypothetical protein